MTTRRDFIKLASIGAGAAAFAMGRPRESLALSTGRGRPAGTAAPYRVGRWLPSDQAVLDRWLDAQIQAAKANPKPLQPVIQELKDLIEGDAGLFMLFGQMFNQTRGMGRGARGLTKVSDYQQMLNLINAIMTTAPTFNKTEMVGCPINAVLDRAMATPAGFAAFLDPRVNAQLMKVLNHWAAFLSSAESCYVLNTDPRHGWFGKDAREAMPHFERHFICDPSRPHYGFASWDDFFTRRFRTGQRPVAAPEDDDVIANACESAPFRIARGVKFSDRFWIKGQPYSLRHMFADDAVAGEFENGTIYQAFLSALSYHRWHSPVKGTVLKTGVINGTYYSQTPAVGFDPASPNASQGYITEVATRGIILIEADNPRIGLMAVVLVGMAEVSTCEITVSEGQRIAKGDEIGMFHFGGSTHCLVFRPGVKLNFDLRGQKPGLDASNIPVRSRLAKVQ